MIYSNIYRYLSAIKRCVCVRVNEKGCIVCAQGGVSIRYLCFSLKDYIFFFLFFFKLLSSSKSQSDISLINGRCAFRKGEKRSGASRAIPSNRPKRSAVDERKRTRNFQRGTRYESNFTFRTRIRSSIFEGKIVILVETCLLFEFNVEVLDRDV